jgi:hypothetical protein
MSDGTHTTEDVWPEPADASEEPTVASGLHADAPTSEYPTLAGEEISPVFADAGPEDDDEDEWPVRAPAKGVRLGIPAAAMLAVTLVALGFWGGAVAQKSHSTATAGGLPAAFAARLRNAASGATGATGATGAGGFQFPGGGTGGSSGTTGTISVVDGDTLYILTASNELVKVKINTSTTVTRNAKSSAAELRPGDTVVVQGATGAGGAVQASSVAATAKGVSSTAGGFGGFTPGGAGGSPGQATAGG